MTEKQRWLLRDLDAWRERQYHTIGKYGPKREPKTPPVVRAAQRAIDRAQRVIKQWEKTKRRPWEDQRDAIQTRYNGVKRIILFEKKPSRR